MRTNSKLTFALAAGLALPLSAQNHSQRDVVDTIVADGESKTLVAALKAAGLVSALRGDGPFTVLAPSDAAFAKLPKGTLQSLLRPENRAKLQRILEYHVIPGALRYGAVSSGATLKTLAGPSITVSRDSKGVVRLDGKTGFNGINMVASNGFVHEIDRVLIPTNENLAQTAQRAGSFRTLLAAAKAAGLVGALTGKQDLTVLAPTDEAFRKLGQDTIRSLLRPENRDKLNAILRYHVVAGRVSAVDAITARSAESLLRRGRLNFGLKEGRLSVQDANVVTNDIQASNGVIHVIDRVLMPPESLIPATKRVGRKVVGAYFERPSKALAAQLGIDRSKTSLITSTTKDGPARRAGLEQYDVVLHIDGKPGTSATLNRAKNARDIGETIEFVVLRKGERRKLSIPVGIARH